ncbi:hypothetical protein H072_8392 [Dactylellina haptotyla CBS 200.50]|uniref:Protein kinase domain-containing protein n=1 Tax=Dactylellina haptotyla (strain CBS 200.50) TaxID=1284197 RepID=S8A9Z9_DACHA|nr:hypothetical protein H072_8392 [Dactylellina haptotyla CBS 200.50]
MVISFSPHRQGGPTPVESTLPFTPFKRSNSGLSSMDVPRHSPSPIPQTRATTRRQGTLARTRSSPTRVALEASSTNNLNCTPPPPQHSAVQAVESSKMAIAAEPFKARQLRGRGIENTPAVSSPLKRRETSATSEAGDLASPRVKRRSQDGITRTSSSRSSSPASGSDSSSTGRSKTSRTSIFASSTGKPISHTPKKPTTLKKVVSTHHFEKPKIARSRLQSNKPPVFNVSTPLAPAKVKRIGSFDNFVSPAPKEATVPQSVPVETSGTPFVSKIISDTPFKKPFPASFSRSTFAATTMPQQSTFATPQITKPLQPHPAGFMSTGLLTKKNRPTNGNGTSFLPPETPCKKPTFMTRKPIQVNTAPPDTPFTTKGRGRLNFTRTESFASIADSGSPEASQANSQQEYLQTPTKRLHTSDSSGSLRGIIELQLSQFIVSQESATPQTPQGSAGVIDLDASRLSISGKPSQPLFPHPSTPRSARDLFGNLTHTPEHGINSPDHSFNTSGLEQTMTPVMDRTSKTFSKEWDPSLESKFAKVTQVGAGEFSVVFEVEEKLASQSSSQLITPENSSENGSPPNPPNMMPRHYAVKRVQFHGQRDRDVRIEEVSVLKAVGKHKNVIEYIDSWETSVNHRVYIQTEFCDLGGLDNFLSDYGNHGRLDPFRIWKTFTEISEGMDYIHEMGFLHLDLKPSNVLISYDGTLKIADFGMATKYPASRSLEREGDREYLAPEVLQRHQYDRPADIFSLGLSLLEIAANVQLPDNGPSWQKLRAGDLGEIPDLTPEGLMNSCIRDERGFPVVINDDSIGDIGNESFGPDPSFSVSPASHLEAMVAKFANNPNFRTRGTQDLIEPPKFMEGDSLKFMINWLISPDPTLRPNTSDILNSAEIRWIKSRRRCGALVYEGEWGPLEAAPGFSEDMDIGDLSVQKLDDDGEDWVMME